MRHCQPQSHCIQPAQQQLPFVARFRRREIACAFQQQIRIDFTLAVHSLFNRLGHRTHVLDRHQFAQTSILQDFTRPMGTVSSNDLALACKRLNQDVAETFVS